MPIWIPQLSLGLGATILFIAMLEATVHVCRGIAPVYDRAQATQQQLRMET